MVVGLALGLTGGIAVVRHNAVAASACPVRDDGMTVLVAYDAECVGFTDSADAGTGRPFSFNPSFRTAVQAQQAVLDGNRAAGPNAITVIWIGALSCRHPGSDTDTERCDDGRRYQAESEELLAMRDLQISQGGGGSKVGVRVLVANAGQDVQRARELAQLIVTHRSRLGSRVVVVGLGDSRASTKGAVDSLLAAAIPVVSPTMTADDEQPGADFRPDPTAVPSSGPLPAVPGYVQLAASNSVQAAALVKPALDIAGAVGARHSVVVYTDDATDTTSDVYVTSMRDHAVAAFATAGWRTTTVVGPGQLAAKRADICRHPGRGGQPGAVLFADRWTHFKRFADAVTTMCGDAGPVMVLADGSAGRFMISDQDRAGLTPRSGHATTWPMVYLGAGLQCYDLRPGGQDPANQAAGVLLNADGARGGADCTPAHPGDVASHTTVAWDAGTAAVSLMTGAAQPAPPATPADARRFLAGLQIGGLQLAEGRLRVVDGRRSGGPLIRPLVACVTDVHRRDPATGTRRSWGRTCLDAFTTMDA